MVGFSRRAKIPVAVASDFFSESKEILEIYFSSEILYLGTKKKAFQLQK